MNATETTITEKTDNTLFLVALDIHAIRKTLDKHFKGLTSDDLACPDNARLQIVRRLLRTAYSLSVNGDAYNILDEADNIARTSELLEELGQAISED